MSVLFEADLGNVFEARIQYTAVILIHLAFLAERHNEHKVGSLADFGVALNVAVKDVDEFASDIQTESNALGVDALTAGKATEQLK